MGGFRGHIPVLSQHGSTPGGMCVVSSCIIECSVKLVSHDNADLTENIKKSKLKVRRSTKRGPSSENKKNAFSYGYATIKTDFV